MDIIFWNNLEKSPRLRRIMWPCEWKGWRTLFHRHILTFNGVSINVDGVAAFIGGFQAAKEVICNPTKDVLRTKPMAVQRY